jgi:hypothetical protein
VVAADLPAWYPDSDGDGYGNPSFVIRLCVQPLNYIDNADDCNDTDFYVHPLDQTLHIGEYEADGVTPYEHRERCNGKVDLCENDEFGDLTPPDPERDDDGDGFVECTLEPNTYLLIGQDEHGHDIISIYNWLDPTADLIGGEDCDDNDAYAYPDAEEFCNGAFENCYDPDYPNQDAPDDELDDDGDCFVECSGFDANSWEGGVHSCEHVDSTGQWITEDVVIGGDDCSDLNEYAYPGSAYLSSSTVCLADFNGDGYSDCLRGFCDYSVNFGEQMDFMLIPSGTFMMGSPSTELGRESNETQHQVTLTHDFYVMTTEVTQGMFYQLMGYQAYSGYSQFTYPYGYGNDYPAYFVSWDMAAAYANAVTQRHNSLYATSLQACYTCSGTGTSVTCTQAVTPYTCTGYRLLTEAEWEYTARAVKILE